MFPSSVFVLGLQGLFEGDGEAPDQKGLGIFPGIVKRFTDAPRIPHMGWNQLDAVRPSRLLKGLPEHPYVYFAHSYYVPVVEQMAASLGTYSGGVYGGPRIRERIRRTVPSLRNPGRSVSRSCGISSTSESCRLTMLAKRIIPATST